MEKTGGNYMEWKRENPRNGYSVQPGKAGAPEARLHHDLWMEFSLCGLGLPVFSEELKLTSRLWWQEMDLKEYLCLSLFGLQTVWFRNHRTLFHLVLESGKSKTKVPADSVAASWIMPSPPVSLRGKRRESALGSLFKKTYKKKKNFICLGCAGLCCVGTLSCHECGWPVAGRWAPHCGGFCCGAQALGWASVVGVRAPRLGLPSSRAQAQSLWCTGGGLVAPPYVGSSWIRDQTCVSCTGRKILKPLATREACLVSCQDTSPVQRTLPLAPNHLPQVLPSSITVRIWFQHMN